jgi:hypothetical protein
MTPLVQHPAWLLRHQLCWLPHQEWSIPLHLWRHSQSPLQHPIKFLPHTLLMPSPVTVLS